MIGISLTTVCYLLVNVAYITVLGASGILASDAVAVVSFMCRDFNGLLYTKFSFETKGWMLFCLLSKLFASKPSPQ